MKKKQSLLGNWRMLLLIVALIVSYVAVAPKFGSPGAIISRVEFNTSGEAGGLETGMLLQEINGIKVKDPETFYAEASRAMATPGAFVQIVADGDFFTIIIRNETSEKPLGVELQPAPSNNIRLGLDLQGGTRALVRPIVSGFVTQNVTDMTLSVLEARMNNYGLREVKLKTVRDIDNNWYVQVEMAGAGSERILDVIKTVGIFELKIRNQTVFTGSAVAAVESSGPLMNGGFGVPFKVKREAAQALADAYTRASIANETACFASADCGAGYACSEERICRPLIEMFLDGERKFSAPAAKSLHDEWMSGLLQQDLIVSVGNPEMAKAVEVVMKSGTLPEGIKGIEIISRDFVEPTLGKDFINSALLAGFFAILAVALVIFLRYRNLGISAAIMVTGISEVILLLGASALLGQDFDLPSIAGIITAVGTGVNQQIIITDELICLSEEDKKRISVFQRLKNAFVIIVNSTMTTVVAMFPLIILGVGMVKGFAIMTLLGQLLGVLITRPAFGQMLAHITETD